MPKWFAFFFFGAFQSRTSKARIKKERNKTVNYIYFRNKIRIQTKKYLNQIKPIINPPSSRGLVFAQTVLVLLWLSLCDCGIGHLDMFYNAKYLSYHGLIPKAIGLEFLHIKWVSVSVWPRVFSLMYLSTIVQSSSSPMQLYFSSRVPSEGLPN